MRLAIAVIAMQVTLYVNYLTSFEGNKVITIGFFIIVFLLAIAQDYKEIIK